MVNDILEHQQLFLLILQKNRPKDLAAAAASARKGEGQDCRTWTSKGSCSRGDKSSFEHNPTEKEKGKELRSRGPVPRNNSPENVKNARRSPFGKKFALSAPTTKWSCTHGRDCDCWDHPYCPDVKTNRCKWGSRCPSIHFQRKRRSHVPDRETKAETELPKWESCCSVYFGARRGLSRDTFTREDTEGDVRTNGRSGSSKQSKSRSRSRTATSVPVPDEVQKVAALDDVVVDGSVSQQRNGILEKKEKKVRERTLEPWKKTVRQWTRAPLKMDEIIVASLFGGRRKEEKKKARERREEKENWVRQFKVLKNVFSGLVGESVETRNIKMRRKRLGRMFTKWNRKKEQTKHIFEKR